MPSADSRLTRLLGGQLLSEDEPDPPDWGRLLTLAGDSLLPFLAFQASLGRLSPPPEIRARLDAARRASGLMLVQRRAALRPAFTALHERGIPFVVLKGLALAYQAYPAPETRVMSDVDLWLGDGCRDDALRALGPLGWHPPWWRSPSTQPATETCLQFGDSAVLLELHHPPASLADAMPGALGELWGSQVRVDLGGLPASVLPPDATLMHLAIHLAEHHRFVNAIGRLLDITLLLRAHGDALDWPSLAARCRTLGIAPWVATSLAVAQRLMDAPVPAGTLDAFAVPDLDRLCDLAEEQALLRPRPGADRRSVLSAPTVAEGAARLRQRVVGLFADGNGRGRARRTLLRLTNGVRVNLPGLLRSLWLNVTHPAEGDQVRGESARNEELYQALRSRAGVSFRDGATAASAPPDPG